MHSYIKGESEGEWIVIFYLPYPQVEPNRHAINIVRTFLTEAAAAAFTSFLNGGNPPDTRVLLRGLASVEQTQDKIQG